MPSKTYRSYRLKARPYKRKTTAFRRRRVYRRPAFRRSKIGYGPMPRTKVVTMQYIRRYTLTTAAQLAVQVMNANSIYDPDNTGVGGQPLGFDQWSVFFKHYCVLWSRCSVRFCNPAGTHTSVVGVYLNGDNTVAPYTDFHEVMEAKRGSSRVIGIDLKQYGLRCNYSPKKFFGIRDLKDNMDQLGSLITGSPATPCYYIIWAQCADGAAAETLDAIVTVTYRVYWTHPNEIPLDA